MTDATLTDVMHQLVVARQRLQQGEDLQKQLSTELILAQTTAAQDRTAAQLAIIKARKFETETEAATRRAESAEKTLQAAEATLQAQTKKLNASLETEDAIREALNAAGAREVASAAALAVSGVENVDLSAQLATCRRELAAAKVDAAAQMIAADALQLRVNQLTEPAAAAPLLREAVASLRDECGQLTTAVASEAVDRLKLQKWVADTGAETLLESYYSYRNKVSESVRRCVLSLLEVGERLMEPTLPEPGCLGFFGCGRQAPPVWADEVSRIHAALKDVATAAEVDEDTRMRVEAAIGPRTAKK